MRRSTHRLEFLLLQPPKRAAKLDWSLYYSYIIVLSLQARTVRFRGQVRCYLIHCCNLGKRYDKVDSVLQSILLIFCELLCTAKFVPLLVLFGSSWARVYGMFIAGYVYSLLFLPVEKVESLLNERRDCSSTDHPPVLKLFLRYAVIQRYDSSFKWPSTSSKNVYYFLEFW